MLIPSKKKLKKKKLKKKKASSAVQQNSAGTVATKPKQLELPLQDQPTPAERIRFISRGFKLSFGDLPGQRTLNDQQRKQVNRDEVKRAKSVLAQSRKLFDKHPLITQRNSAKEQVLGLFRSLTQPWPESSARILVLKTQHLDFSAMSEVEVEKEFASQVDEFSRQINEALATIYQPTVETLQRNWGDVLEVTRQSFVAAGVPDLFVAADYPTAADLPSLLYSNFRPYNIEPHREYSHVSPLERQRVLQQVEAQFRESCEMQAEFVSNLMKQAVDQLVESIGGYHNKQQRSFRNSVISRVFEAFREFREKTIAYGILSEDAISREFYRLERIMTEGGLDAENLPDLLRRSPGKREDLLGKVTEVQQTITELVTQRANQRRSIQRD